MKNNKRPEITTLKNTPATKDIELFQNETLRPILKMQHDLLVLCLEVYLKRKKISFSTITVEKKKEVIQTILKKDNLFKAELRGIIIGHFTLKEYQCYETMLNEVNKRIITMAAERLISTLE